MQFLYRVAQHCLQVSKINSTLQKGKLGRANKPDSEVRIRSALDSLPNFLVFFSWLVSFIFFFVPAAVLLLSLISRISRVSHNSDIL